MPLELLLVEDHKVLLWRSTHIENFILIERDQTCNL
jgi:hypothetical protein